MLATGLAPASSSAQTPVADTLSSPSIAEPAERDSIVPARGDSLTPEPGPRLRRTLPRPGRLDQPRWVMLRSLLVPGWGQAHNGAWIKAALVAVGDGTLRVRFFRDERRLGDLNGTAAGTLAELESADRTLVSAQAVLAAAQAELTAAEAEIPPNPARIAAAQTALAAAQTVLNAASLTRAGASDAYNSAVIAYNALLSTSVNRRWLLGGVVLYALIDAYVDAHFKNFDINLQFDPALPGGTGVPGARLQIRWAF
jgi:hypothetical protein